MSVISVLRRLNLEDHGFGDSLGYIARPCLKNKCKKKKKVCKTYTLKTLVNEIKENQNNWLPVAHAYNPSYFGG
jgi:hypothetical protein